MTYEPENNLHSEFNELPEDDRLEACELKEDYDERKAKALRYRKIRNGIGAAALVVAGGLGIARLTVVEQYSDEVLTPVVVVAALATAVAGSYHGWAREEDADAEKTAGVVASMFVYTEQEPPIWTQQAIPTT